MRVIRVDVPIESISLNESELICEKREFLSSVPKPIAAFAAKYCAVTELISPTVPRAKSAKPIL